MEEIITYLKKRYKLKKSTFTGIIKPIRKYQVVSFNYRSITYSVVYCEEIETYQLRKESINKLPVNIYRCIGYKKILKYLQDNF